MPIVQYNLKLSESERKLLAKRAQKEGVSEADHLRVCMVLDAVMAGDLDALKITGDALRRKLGERLQGWKARGVFDGFEQIAPGLSAALKPFKR